MRYQLVVSLALSATACGEGSRPPEVVAPLLVPTITVAALEGSGKLPVLDRGQGLQGVDANRNGVRDDLDAWVASQGFSSPQVKAATQAAQALQQALAVDLADDRQLRNASSLSGYAIHCVMDRFPAEQASFVLRTLEKYTMNTQPRVMQYLRFNQALNGSVLTQPQGDTCA